MDFAPITHDEITARAHTLWERQGRPEGRDLEHWLQAEAELRQEQARMAQEAERIPAKESMPVTAAHQGSAPREELSGIRSSQRGMRRRTGGAK